MTLLEIEQMIKAEEGLHNESAKRSLEYLFQDPETRDWFD
tara:strand:+ start:2930 stop:3049 length:120 start_codon:yes stop_codon:yes gene_type:complete